MDSNDPGLDDDDLRRFMPASFGKQTREANVQAQIDQSKRVVTSEPKKLLAGYDSDSDEDKQKSDRSGDDDDDDDESDEEDEFPVSHELKLKTHESAVTTVTLDNSGARMVTGSKDCTLKFHDFASMTPTTIRAFKSVDPAATKVNSNVEAHPIYQVLFNPLSSRQLLVITALPQAKIFSRDGELQTEFAKGDMYLRDMHNTKGHVSEVTSGAWHPTNWDLCVTAGTDSTLRIWDVNKKRAQKDVIVHKSQISGSGGRTRMTAVAWGSPAQGGPNVLVAAALDGSLAMWSGEGPYSRPAGVVREAHERDKWTSGIDISSDGRLVITRGGDDTIKLWDIRKFKTPVNTTSHKSTSAEFPTSNIRFSPNSSSVLVGSDTGHLHILNPATLRPELVTPVTPGSPVVTVLWHEKLNQIITGSANAEVHVLYNPNTSNAGAKAVMTRAPKKRHVDDDPNLTMDLSQGISGDAIITPGGNLSGSGQPSTSFASRHPQVGLTASGKSRDPRRPHIPAATPFAKTNPDEKHIKESIPLSSMRDEDPREALLKYQEKAQKDPLFTNAWKTTQPKTIYAELSDEEEEPETKRVKR